MERAEDFILPVNFWNWCLQQDRPCRAHAPARSHAGQPRRNQIRVGWNRNVDDDAHDLARRQTRAAMLATGMEGGMEASYIRLEKVISASQAPTEIAS